MSPLLFLSWVNCIVSKDILFGQAYYKEISNIHASSFLFFLSLELCKEVQENSVKRQREEILEFSSVQLFSRVQLFVIPWTTECQASLSITNTQSLLKLMSIDDGHVWCHPTISSSVIPFASHLQSFPASGSFPVCQLFSSGGQRAGVSASASVLPMTTQDRFPLGWTGWISLQSKGLSRVFSNTTVQKHQFFSAQLSLWSNSHIHTWLLEKS